MISRFQLLLAMYANWYAAFPRPDELGWMYDIWACLDFFLCTGKKYTGGTAPAAFKKVTFLLYAWFGGQEEIEIPLLALKLTIFLSFIISLPFFSIFLSFSLSFFLSFLSSLISLCAP